ncbi:hypothetical protein ACHAWF_013899 [Thalassiosira exigua]
MIYTCLSMASRLTFNPFVQSNTQTAKAQKAIYSKIIYDEVRAMSPPGRFLKQDPKTKLWNDIGEKKALDKTRQALREGAPEILKEMESNFVGNMGSMEGNAGELGDAAPLHNSMTSAPLHNSISGGGNQLGSSMTNISLGSFSLNSGGGVGGSNSFTAGTSNASFPIPQQLGVNNLNMFDAQGMGSIIGAAVQAQQQEQQRQSHQNQQHQLSSSAGAAAELNAQLQLLKLQMQLNAQQANLAAAVQQQGGSFPAGGRGMGNDQNAGLSAMLTAAQQGNGNLPIGNNEMTLLAAICESESGKNNNGKAGIGVERHEPHSYQQQLAQMSMDRVNSRHMDSDSTLNTGNLCEEIRQAKMESRDSMASTNSFGSAMGGHNSQQATFEMLAQKQQQHEWEGRQNQSQQQHIQGSGTMSGQTFNKSVPLNAPSNSFDPSNRRKSRRSGAEGLNSSFTRAQRIGLKNSLTRRPNRHFQTELQNSLMSIESLTLDDMDSMGAVSEGMFDSDDKLGHHKTGGKHGNGAYNMSDGSDLDFDSECND